MLPPLRQRPRSEVATQRENRSAYRTGRHTGMELSFLREKGLNASKKLKLDKWRRKKMKKLTDCRSDEYPMKARLSDDSEGLGFWGDKKFVVGHVPEVNGLEACDVPTKHELIQIAKYWLQRVLNIQLWFFATGQRGSSEWREDFYAALRIHRIAAIVPEQELNQAIEEVERDFKQERKISDEDWDIFKNGTQEQWKSFQYKLWREFESQNSETPAADGREQLNK
jgi:hypothetical protein